ncbi:MAG: GNAT family N-acetyltransferase [Planctomycetota bacterium]|nr:MAG: GNAT family N-acetyltransferase [Planctomycetota bacterium]
MSESFSPLRLAPYTPRHHCGVLALVGSCYAEYGQVLELRTLDADLAGIEDAYPWPEATFQVLLEGERVVGTVAVRQLDAATAELKRLYLLARWRGQGIGKRLALWACEWARRRGCSRVRLWSDVHFETAHALYEHLGARRTGRSRRLGGVNDVREDEFELALEPACP